MAIKGIYAASVSIFNKDLSLDIDSTIKHTEKLIKEGCHGVVIFWKYWSSTTHFLN